MIAQENKAYAQIVGGVVRWIFTRAQLPEWAGEAFLAVDITDHHPRPGEGWTYAGGVFSNPDAATLPDFKSKIMRKIDDRFAQIYFAFTRFKDEYEMREAAARAYKAAGYTGAVSAWISSFANASGVSNSVATDTIIAQADAARGAVPILGGLRMRKYEILGAQDIETAQTIADSILAQANTIAGQLGIA